MESAEVNLCRLCARIKFPNELVVDDDSLDIEAELIVYCHWNTFS